MNGPALMYGLLAIMSVMAIAQAFPSKKQNHTHERKQKFDEGDAPSLPQDPSGHSKKHKLGGDNKLVRKEGDASTNPSQELIADIYIKKYKLGEGKPKPNLPEDPSVHSRKHKLYGDINAMLPQDLSGHSKKNKLDENDNSNPGEESGVPPPADGKPVCDCEKPETKEDQPEEEEVEPSDGEEKEDREDAQGESRDGNTEENKDEVEEGSGKRGRSKVEKSPTDSKKGRRKEGKASVVYFPLRSMKVNATKNAKPAPKQGRRINWAGTST